MIHDSNLLINHSTVDDLYIRLVDLYMMHWPLCPSWVGDVRKTLNEAWRSMEKLLEDGTCRSIGVSNFSIQDLDNLMDNCSVVPQVSARSDETRFRPRISFLSVRMT